MTVKVWDNGIVHVVSGPKGVVIAIPRESAHRLALVLAKRNLPEGLEGWRELQSIREALDCILVGDPDSVSRAKYQGHLKLLVSKNRKVAEL